MAFGRAWLIQPSAPFLIPIEIPLIFRRCADRMEASIVIVRSRRCAAIPVPRSSRVTTDEAFNAFSIRSAVNPAYRNRRKEFTSYEEVSLSLSVSLSPCSFFFSFHRLGSALNFDRLSRIFVRRLLLRGETNTVNGTEVSRSK